MPVTASSLAFDGPAQADDSRWVRETHNVTGGGTLLVNYLAAPGSDATAMMNTRVASLNARLAEEEALANIERDGALTLLHQTGAQMASRLREEIRGATQARACYLAWWVLRRIAAGHLTDAQLQSAFSLTAAQWTSLKTNTLTPRSNAWAAVLAAVGA